MDEKEIRAVATTAATTLMGPLTTKTYVTTEAMFNLSDEIANYIRNGTHNSDTKF